MSDKRISELTELPSGQIVGTDLVPVVDVSDTTHAASGTTKKTTFAAILAYINAHVGGAPTIEWVDLLGDVDGVNDLFTLAAPPANGLIEVSMARQQQFEGLDYAYDDDITIIFATPPDESLSAEPLKALVY